MEFFVFKQLWRFLMLSITLFANISAGVPAVPILPKQKISINQVICNPPGDEGVKQFVIGYGSLMSTASKNRTYPNTSENIPIRVQGYKRIWNCKGTSISKSTTYLGSKVDPDESFNGVIFSLDDGDEGLLDFDARESFYCRQEVVRSSIKVLGNVKNKFLPLGQYWIYVTLPQHSALPSRDYPVVQSYVDTFLTGCLELEEKFGIQGFSDECITSTNGWPMGQWVNDRIYPRRPFIFQPKAGAIDKLLARIIFKQYNQIRMES